MATILHLITGLEAGGAEGMLARLATHSDPARFTSIVVSMTDAGTIGPSLAAAGIAVETLGIRRGAIDPRGVTRLVRLLRAWRPDIIQTWLYHADLLGLLASRLAPSAPLLWNIRCSESLGSTVVRAILARLSALPQRVVVNSLTGQRYHEAIGYRPRRWAYIPNGFDTAALRPDGMARRRLRSELAIGGDAVAVGMVARYHPMKDHATFLAAAAQAAARRPELVFLLVGAGIDQTNRELMQAIAAHGIGPQVRLLGPRADMGAVYPAFDMLVSSSAFGEGFTNVLGEAMSCGVPCIATASGDAAEIVGPAGIVVACRDPAALGIAIARLASAPDERRGRGAASRERVEREYGLAAIVARYAALYDEVLADGGTLRRSA